MKPGILKSWLKSSLFFPVGNNRLFKVIDKKLHGTLVTKRKSITGKWWEGLDKLELDYNPVGGSSSNIGNYVIYCLFFHI
jgi:hypothetical protein